jgi:subtilisin family serine protease
MHFTNFISRPIAGLVLLICLYQSPALANRVYQVSDGAWLSLKAISAGNEIVDSIPQLGLVVTRKPLEAAGSFGLNDLGDVARVHLIEPHQTARLDARAAADKLPSSMWDLRAIHLAEAWKVSKGAGVIVAVSDTGVSANHPELATQMWENPGETGLDLKGRNKASNGVDDDGNGYVDDVHGWDFVKNKPGGVDHHYHGTHVAGTIASAVSKSMAGIAPMAKIMDVSFLDSHGSGDDIGGAKTLVYAVDQGAKIINCSWGGPDGANIVLEKAIAYANAHGVLVIAAAGNASQNNDRHTFTPSGYAYDNIIAVGATSTVNGTMASFSNYGLKTVDLAAPGDQIYSLAPGGGHQVLSGTSMASPHVAGVAALVWSAHPNYTMSQVKTALMAVKPVSSWKRKCVSGGILEADLAVTH